MTTGPLIPLPDQAAVPPCVEYALTELGRSLLVPLGSLVDWSSAHHRRLREARQRYDVAIA